jgi:hypothetical protein
LRPCAPGGAITVADWFDSTADQLRDITAGGLKLDGQVAQVVQAMANLFVEPFRLRCERGCTGSQ